MSRAKVTEDDVREIRKLVSGGMMMKDAAVIYQISPCAISNIIHRHRWAHVA